MRSYNSIIIFFIFFLNILPCHAQFKIKLDDVVKFDFEMRGGGLSSYRRNLRVSLVNKNWKCVELQPIGTDGKNGIMRYAPPFFIKNIPADTLQFLLDRFAIADSTIDIKQFNLDKASIISEFDSLVGVKFKPEQRAELVAAVQSEQRLKRTVNQLLYPREADDKDYYGIDITTKSNITYHVFAYSFGYPYHLPWTVGYIQSYDPEISIVFNQITGHPAFAKVEHKRFQQNIALELYRNELQTRFNFGNLKTDYPASFKILNNTFIPVSFTSEVETKTLSHLSRPINEYYSSVFKSSRLPSYVQMSFSFKLNDTALLKSVKRYEDTLVRCFKKNNFFFDYLKTRYDCKAIFTPANMGNRGKWMFRALKTNFPGIDKYDYKKTQLITIVSPAVIVKWMLLPDNTLILCQYKNADGPASNNIQFMGLNKLLDDCGYSGQEEVCLIFNASGKLIHDYGVVERSFID